MTTFYQGLLSSSRSPKKALGSRLAFHSVLPSTPDLSEFAFERKTEFFRQGHFLSPKSLARLSQKTALEW